ncbi:MAG: hypothetical protein R6V31_12440, partial [Halohasta sp.]
VRAVDAEPAADHRRFGGERDRSPAGSTTDRAEDRTLSVPVEELAGLAAELRSLKEAVESLAERRRTAEATTGGFEWVDAPQPAVPIEALAERIEALEARAVAIESALDAVRPTDLETAVDRQQAAYAELEARLEADLDGIEAVFEQLLSTTDELDERLEAVEAAREAAIEPLQRRTAEQAALVGLTREALCHGVSTADCDHCGQSVDIGLLEEPYCPGCDRRFTAVDAGGWLPFSSATLRTAGRHALGRVLGVDAESAQR